MHAAGIQTANLANANTALKLFTRDCNVSSHAFMLRQTPKAARIGNPFAVALPKKANAACILPVAWEPRAATQRGTPQKSAFNVINSSPRDTCIE